MGDIEKKVRSRHNMTSLTSHMKKVNRNRNEGSYWQLQVAKARFSELFRRVRSEGPQYVTRGGKETVVVLPAEEYERLTAPRQARSLLKFFADSPLVGAGLDIDRKPDYGRKVEL